jgi:integrase
VLSEVEAQWLMTAARTSKALWLPAALTVLMTSAMRRGELFGLRRSDIDFTVGIAHLHETKNGSPRDVPLCPAASSALQELDRAAQQRGDALLLPLGSAGSLTTRFTVTVRRARVLYRSDCRQQCQPPLPGFLEDFRLHDLRHHAVTALASTGRFSMLELMAISGHKTPRMVARYTHLDAAALAVKLARVRLVDEDGNGAVVEPVPRP